MSETLSDYGISIELPDGWYGEIYRDVRDLDDSGPNLHFGNTPLILGDRNTYVSDARQGLRAEDVVVAVANLPSMPQIIAAGGGHNVGPRDGWSLKNASDLTFHGVPTGKSSRRKVFQVAQRVFDLVAFFGAEPPPPAKLSELDAVLGSVRVDVTPPGKGDRLDQYFNVEAAVRADSELREAIWARDRPHASAEERAEHARAFGGG